MLDRGEAKRKWAGYGGGESRGFGKQRPGDRRGRAETGGGWHGEGDGGEPREKAPKASRLTDHREEVG